MPGDYIEDRRMSKKDRLIAYLKSNKLDPEMEEMWAQYEFIEDKLRSMKKFNAMQVVCKKYGIGRSQAYKLIKEVEVFSGIAHAPDKQYLKWVQIEGLQRDIELARVKGDFKSVSSLRRELRLWLYEDQEQDLEMMKKLQLHQFNIQINMAGDKVDVPLSTFYKLKESEKKHLVKNQEQSFPDWEEVKTMINGEES
jgi:ACT domain-containing protein